MLGGAGETSGDPAAAAPGLRARVTAARLLKGAAADPAPAPAWRGFEPLPEWAGPRGPRPAAEPILGAGTRVPGRTQKREPLWRAVEILEKHPHPGKSGRCLAVQSE